MKHYMGEVITGPQGGHIAVVSNGDRAYEIHPLGRSRDREFYSRPAAEQLALGHAEHINRKGDGALSSSFVRRV